MPAPTTRHGNGQQVPCPSCGVEIGDVGSQLPGARLRAGAELHCNHCGKWARVASVQLVADIAVQPVPEDGPCDTWCPHCGERPGVPCDCVSDQDDEDEAPAWAEESDHVE